jgi:hypothetical protein
MITEATGNKWEWVARAKGMAPSWGVTESHATVRFERRRWLPVQEEDEGARLGSSTGRVGEAPKRTGRLERVAWRG